jgi:hypothetical protein
MTRAISSGNGTALAAGSLVARDMIWFTVRDRGTGAAVDVGYWSDVFTITANVIDPETGSTVPLTFSPAGGLIAISDIALVSDLTVQTVTIKLSQVADAVNTLLRTYDCKQGKVKIWRALFDPDGRNIVAPALPRFLGTIDQAPVITPKENAGDGNVTLTCIDNTQELMRSNPDTCSDASQRLRSATDDLCNDVVVVPTWQQFWGREGGGRITTSPFSAAFKNGALGMFHE